MPDEQNSSDALSDSSVKTESFIRPRRSRLGQILLAGGLVVMATGLFWLGPDVWALVQDEQALEAWVISLGWLGPVALVALNAIQIIVAPIPGYVLQLAAGYLFGPFWGGIWGNLGLLIGASMAFWLARTYGRPLAGRLVGEDRLAKWEHMSHSSSTLVHWGASNYTVLRNFHRGDSYCTTE